MCGDLEEDDADAERLYAAFLQAAHGEIHEALEHRGGSRGCLAERANERSEDNTEPLSDEALHAYMDGLFGDILNACIKDGRYTTGSDRYRVLASQAVVMARVAGFLAGRLDAATDPLRTSIEALMAGYGSQQQ
jgi:hypothetical protein